MTDREDDSFDTVDEGAAGEGRTVPREQSEQERRLRRDLSRSREQIRTMQSERDTSVAAIIKEKEDAIATIRAQSTARLLIAELKAHALKAGILDVDALRLADTSSLALSDDGIVSGAEAVLEKLRTDKPYLFNDSRLGVSTGTTGQTQRPPSPAIPLPLDARTLSREAWHSERDRLLGRVHRG